MLTTPELIIALERRGVLPPGDVARVRQLYENSPTEFVPRVMFKWLVARSRITPEQAEKLMAVDPSLSAAQALDRVLGEDHDLQLAPDDDLASYDEDTKDMPREAASGITLSPPNAPFADSPTSNRPTLIPSQTPAKPKEKEPAARPAAAELIDELFAQTGGEGGLRPALAPVRFNDRRSRWDSPLMLTGGGALLLLVGLAAFFTWRIVRQGGDSAFAAAEESYRTGGYGTAVERYDRFLADYPAHRSAGQAVVHRGLARLRLAVEAGGDWSKTLELAKLQLPEIAAQPEFAASKGDLAALLPDISENLAKQAAAKLDKASADQAREARKMVDKYVGAMDATAPRLQQIDALIAAADRRLLRGESLASAIAAIRQAAASRNLEEAAKIRGTLLVEFPDVAAEPALLEAMSALADTKRQAVRFAALDAAAETAPPASPIVRKVTLIDRHGNSIPDVDDVYPALVEGSLFALNAADGRPRWTRPIGFDAGAPTIVDASAGRDLLFYDAVERALVRTGAADGALRWRQPAAAAASFVVEGERAFVTLQERLAIVDAASGRVTGEVHFPAPLANASASDPRQRVRYQLGRMDDLFVVSNDDFRCLQAYYVGHAAGSIAVPPTCVGPYVLLAQNIGEQTRLRLLETGADGAGLNEIASRTIDGRVTLPPQVSQRLVAVVTNGGPVELFDLSGAGDRKPLEPVAKLTSSPDRVTRRHFVFRGTQLWLGGQGLSRYEFQPSLGKFSPVRSLLDDRTTLQAPQLVGGALICRMQPNDFSRPASTIALDVARGSVIWETAQPSAPITSPLAAKDGKTLTLVTTGGAVYDVVADGPAVLDRPTTEFGAGVAVTRRSSDVAASGTAADFILPDGAAVFLGSDERIPGTDRAGKDSLLVLNPSGTEPRVAVTPPLDEFSADPVVFRDGVVVPTRFGQVQWLDPRTGKRKAEPYLPPTIPPLGVKWPTRAVIAGDDILMSDNLELLRLRVEPQPQPFLKSAGVADFGRQATFVGAAGSTLYFAEAGGEVTPYALSSLRAGASLKIRGLSAGRTTALADGLVGVAVEGRLSRSDVRVVRIEATGDGQILWQTPMTRPSPDRRWFAPLVDGEECVTADDRGDLLRFDLRTGKEKSRTSLGVSLAAPPILVDKQLVLTTLAGEILWIAQP